MAGAVLLPSRVTTGCMIGWWPPPGATVPMSECDRARLEPPRCETGGRFCQEQQLGRKLGTPEAATWTQSCETPT